MQNTIKYKKIIFFCEKSKKIGGGHFIRSKRLFLLLRYHYKCTFYLNKTNLQIKNILKKNKKSIVIFDLKKFYKNIFINNFKNYYIAFDNKKKFCKNLININPLEFNNNKFSGPKWFLYPKKFKLKNTKRKKIKNLLICQGLTDANNNLNKIVKIASSFSKEKKIKIFVKVPKKNYIKKNMSNLNNIVEIPKINNLSKFLSKIDFAITSTGNFSYELGHLKIPCIYVSDEPNEIKRGKIYRKKKIGKIFTSNEQIKIVKELYKIFNNKNYYQFLIKRLGMYFKYDSEKNYKKLFNKILNEKI
tara:strand:+ start:860 stop:1765 length:906 start_codon:yes stop_codon:yes gene_type:complete